MGEHPFTRLTQRLHAFARKVDGELDELGARLDIVEDGSIDSSAIAAIDAAIPRTLYVSPDGNGNGITSETPTTLPAAIAIHQMWAGIFPGDYTIRCAAGTYTGRATGFLNRKWAASTLTFTGAPPVSGVPVTIFEGANLGGSRTAEFVRISDGAKVTFNDIFARTYGAFVRSSRNAVVAVNRVHTVDCQRVVSIGNGGIASISGGNWDGRDLTGTIIPDSNAMLAVITSPYDLTQPDDYSGLLIHHFERGVVVSEGSSGHLDYLRIEDCGVGMEISRGAGAPNTKAMRIHRCTVGFLARDVTPFIADSFDFGMGTANACTTAVMYVAGPTYHAGQRQEDSRLVYRFNTVGSGGIATGSTAEASVWRPLTTIAGRPREGDVIHVKQNLRFSGGLTAAVTVRLKAGATTLATATFPIGAVLGEIEAELYAIDATSINGTLKITHDSGSSSVVSELVEIGTTAVFSPTANTIFDLTLQPASTGVSYQRRSGFCDTSIAGVTLEQSDPVDTGGGEVGGGDDSGSSGGETSDTTKPVLLNPFAEPLSGTPGAVNAMVTPSETGPAWCLINTSSTTPNISVIQSGMAKQFSTTARQIFNFPGSSFPAVPHYAHFHMKDNSDNDAVPVTYGPFTPVASTAPPPDPDPEPTDPSSAISGNDVSLFKTWTSSDHTYADDFWVEGDPTTYTGISYAETKTHEVMRQEGSNANVACYIFSATYSDMTGITVAVEASIGTQAVGLTYATHLATRLGRLPAKMRTNLRTGTQSAMVIPATGEIARGESVGHFIAISKARIDTRVPQGKLEETMFHELVHATLQQTGNGKGFNYLGPYNAPVSGWLSAVNADNGKAVTPYAASTVAGGNYQEDFAETVKFAYIRKHKPDRMPAGDRTVLAAWIPNRIAYCDTVVFP